MTTVVGLDIGTTSVSCVAFNAEGRMAASYSAPHGADVQGPGPFCAEQSPERLRAAALQALRTIALKIAPADVACLGLTGQMHSTVFLNSAMKVTGNVLTWQDQRAAAASSGQRSPLDQLGDTIRGLPTGTGCDLAPGYMGTSLFTLRLLNQMPAGVSRVSFVADWLASVLVGQPPVTDRSHAASSGLFDLSRDGWSSPHLAATQVDADWLPDVLESGVIIGQLSSDTAADTGLPCGTPVSNAIGDHQAAVLSAFVPDRSSLLINIGTGGQICWSLDEFRRLPGMETRYLPDGSDSGKFLAVGAGLCGGAEFAWLVDFVDRMFSDFGVAMTKDALWSRLMHLCDGAPVDSGLTCTPFFFGTRPSPDCRAEFSGVGADNFSIADMAISIAAGIADSMYQFFNAAPQNRPHPLNRVFLAGNGARRNRILVNAVEKRFEASVTVSPFEEEAATGAAMQAGVAAGVWDDLNSARQRIHKSAGETKR